MKHIEIHPHILRAFLLWTITTHNASASVSVSACNTLAESINSAHAALKQAENEKDLNSAKEYAWRANIALSDSAIASIGCNKCAAAYMEFDAAASHTSLSKYAENHEKFTDSLNKAINSFHYGIESIRACIHQKKN